MLPFSELKAKSEAIRKRKAKALEEKSKPIQSEAAVKKGKYIYIYLLFSVWKDVPPEGLAGFSVENLVPRIDSAVVNKYVN